MTIDIDKSAIGVSVSMVRGDDFKHTFRIGGKEDALSPTEYWDLTGWTLRGHVRRKESDEILLATMDVSPYADQTVDKGKFMVEISDDATSGFPRSCVGDIEFVDPDGKKRTYFRIDFTIGFDSTRVN